jgi:hypothetical protein
MGFEEQRSMNAISVVLKPEYGMKGGNYVAKLKDAVNTHHQWRSTNTIFVESKLHWQHHWWFL